MSLLIKSISRTRTLVTAGVLLGAFNISVCAQDWTKATVKDLDVAKGKLLLDHDVIQKWGMPAMRMVFFVNNADLLSNLRKGDEIKFIPGTEGKKFVVIDLRKLP